MLYFRNMPKKDPCQKQACAIQTCLQGRLRLRLVLIFGVKANWRFRRLNIDIIKSRRRIDRFTAYWRRRAVGPPSWTGRPLHSVICSAGAINCQRIELIITH